MFKRNIHREATNRGVRAFGSERQRSKLGSKLRDLMAWYQMAKLMPCAEVAVMEILHEFRSLAGIRGRNAHRGQAPPQYDTRVKVKIDDATRVSLAEA